MSAAQAEARRAAEAVATARAALDTQRNRRAFLEAEIDRIEAARREIEQTLTEAAGRTDAADAARADAQTARDASETALRDAERQRTDLDEQIESVGRDLREAHRRLDASTAEAGVLQSLLDSYEGFSDAVQTLLTQPDWADAPRTVADLLACDPEYRPAVDAALGPFASCLVVETEAEAHAGIERLRADDAGRATFVVLDRLPDAPDDERPVPDGTVAIADVVRTDAAYRPLARLLLRDTFLAPSLAEASALHEAYPFAHFVTPDGEWTSARGILHAGGAAQSAGAERLGQRERLDVARADVDAATAEVDSLETRDQALRAERDALALDARRTALREAERALDVRDREASQVAYDVAAQTRRQAELDTRRTELRAERDAAEATDAQEAALADAQRAHADAQQARTDAEAAYAVADAAGRDALARFSEANLATVQARNQLDALRRDRDRAERTIRELAERETARQAEAERVRVQREEAAGLKATQEARATRLRDGRADLDTAVKHAETAVSDARSAISDTDVLLRDVRRLREDAQQRQAAGAVRLGEIGTRMEAVAERVWDEYGVALGEVAPPAPDFDADAARREVPTLREKLRGLGAVNELALESYEEEKERLDFLRAQQADLEQAEASLRSTIREINATASARFDETFQAVRREFQRLFVDLFGENASADIVLAGDDPLESPVEIRARPKGKKPSGIAQLSGGEKTLTAIALLFAIYLVKPSPFCILDEVDAPLDDSNVERFMGLIRSFSASTQFILVTHNKLTMEAADRMYGVTMQEEGVSKLVGVTFDEAT